eukprot:1058_1
MILVCIPSCENKQGRISGIGLILGAILYICGWIYFISTYKDAAYDGWTDEEKEDWDAEFLSWFGEALMYSATSTILGIDVLLQIFQNEANRLAINLGVLMIVCMLVMPAYYIKDGDGVEAIGTGYIIIMLTAAVYIILYVLTCCTCDCKDRTIVRIVLCIALFVGGLVTACGYYVYAGGNDGFAQLGDEGDEAKRIAFYVGYTILTGGLCFIWGIDIAWDDVKERDQVQACCKGC